MYHSFDGDGMPHVVGFRDGKAFYRNRFVRTDGFLAENDAGGLSDGPVCKLQLPELISSGTHSTWAPGTLLRRWNTMESAASAIGL